MGSITGPTCVLPDCEEEQEEGRGFCLDHRLERDQWIKENGGGDVIPFPGPCVNCEL